jgi:hypothetical protein
VRASAPACGVGIHRVKIEQYSSDDTLLYTFLGTSEVAPSTGEDPPTLIQTRSYIHCWIGALANDYFLVKHYCAAAVTNGLGVPASLSWDEYYAEVTIERVYTPYARP